MYSLKAGTAFFENLNYDEYRELWERFGDPRRPPLPPPEGYDGKFSTAPVAPVAPPPAPAPAPTPEPMPPKPDTPEPDIPITGQKSFGPRQWKDLRPTYVAPGRAKSYAYPGKILVFTERDGLIVVDFEDE